MGVDLLQTKFYVPALQTRLVPRAQIYARLTEKLQQGSRLSLLSAPAGFGKTTLAASWLRETGMQIAWLSLDEDDDDPARFMDYLLAAVQQHGWGVGKKVEGILAAPQKPPLQILLTALVNDIANRPDPPNSLALVLDDYHLIENQDIHQALSFLLEHQPPQLHLVIITREDPPLPLARIRARQQMTEVRLADLRFTSVETSMLLNSLMGFNLTAPQIDALEDRTEGWIAGLQLAALSLQGQEDVDAFVRSFAGSNRYILDFLIEEVFQRQPPEVQAFLLTTAILDQFSAPLCDALLFDNTTPEAPREPSRSQGILEQLEQANLFIIPLDRDRHWYRYHHLFADLLRHRLRQENRDLPDLHARAAAWHAANGFPTRAINHYLAAEAWEQAADLISTQTNPVLKRGENVTLLRWVRRLPEAVIFQRPVLCLDLAWALALSGDFDQADTFLHVVEKAAEREPALQGRVLTAQIHIARARHDLARTIALSQHALALIPPQEYETRCVLNLNLGIAYWHSGLLDAAIECLQTARTLALQAHHHHVELLAAGMLGILTAAQGDLGAAEAGLQETLAGGAGYPASALAHSTLGAILYEWNQLEDAGAHMQQAIDLAELGGNTEVLSGAYRQMAFLKQAQGQGRAALDALNKAVYIAGDDAPPLTRGRNAAAFVCLALAQGDLDTARQWAAHMPAAAASPFYLHLHLAPARLSLATGDRKSAAAQLAEQYEKAIQAGWRYGQIETRLLQALAAPGDKEASDFVADALVLAEPGRFIRTFTEKGSALIPFLHTAASQNITPQYARQLLAEFGQETLASETVSAPQLPQPDLVEPLSERELEVLHSLAAGHSNQEIAQALIVSVNTVKSHLKNIYGKLGVTSRRAAVAQARVRGLIRPDGP